MPQANEQNTDPKSLETRFGLVMYGGVSLAIYINGVAQEFFNAVRGRGVYKFIKALTDTEIVVDIISGTSAGGINGIMLAYALCNEREFSDTANLWRNDGDIRRLLRSPGMSADTTSSLLDSEGYYQPQLEAAFRDMRAIQGDMTEEVSPFQELDLFVTGTDIDGNCFTQFDDAGHPIEVKDHRSVFHLKHRAGRKEPFNPKFVSPEEGDAQPNQEVTYKALGKLSRITSCFPAAFSPVAVANDEPSHKTPDGKLQLWGSLGKESCFLDGGLIDNKPFTYTLREIFFRAAEGMIDRKLFYIEPDPEHWEQLESASQPNFYEAIIASLIGIPGYESISDDLKLLGSHNSKIQRYKRLVSIFEGKNRIEPPTPQVADLYKRGRLIALSDWVAQGVLKTDGRNALLDPKTKRMASDLIAMFDRVVLGERGKSESANGGAAPKDEVVAKATESPRTNTPKIDGEGGVPSKDAASGETAAGTQEEEEFLKNGFKKFYDDFIETLKEENKKAEALEVTRKFLREYEKAKFGLPVPDSADPALENFDVDFRLRRLFHTVYFILKKLDGIENAALVCIGDSDETLAVKFKEAWKNAEQKKLLILARNYKHLWRAVNRFIELLDIINGAMQRVIDDSSFDWQTDGVREEIARAVWRKVLAALMSLLNNQTDAAKVLRGAQVERRKDGKGHVRLLGEPWKIEHKEWSEGCSEFNNGLRRLAHDIAEVTNTHANKGEVHYDPATGSIKLPKDFKYDPDQSVLTFPASFRSILCDIDDRVKEIFIELALEDDDPVRRTYDDFTSLDAKLFPVELIAELHEKDIIKTYRISPHDAKKGFSNKGLSDKVSGDTLYHFGGFFKRSWRSNDILWGRLDCLCQLVETLVDADRLKEVLKNPSVRKRVRERLYGKDMPADGKQKLLDEMSPARLFPRAGEATHRELEEWLGKILPGKGADSVAALEAVDKDFDRWVELLIQAAQLEVIGESLPQVITDSLQEQIGWNQFRIKKSEFEDIAEHRRPWIKTHDDPAIFHPPSGDVDSFFGVVAAAGQAVDWMKAVEEADKKSVAETPGETHLGRYFRNDYKVGTEALLRDMPLIILLEIVSVSLLVLRNCILSVFGSEKAERVRSHPLYVVVIEAPLRTFNVLVRFIRRAPRQEKNILTAVFLFSLLTLLVAAVFGLYKSGTGFEPLRFGFLIILPTLLTYGSAVYMSKLTGMRKWPKRVVDGLVSLLLHAALLVAPLVFISIIWRGLPSDSDATKAAVIVLLVVAAAGPFVAFYLLSRRLRKRRLKQNAGTLRDLMENYFNAGELRAVGRRLAYSVPLEWGEVYETLCKGDKDEGREQKEKRHEVLRLRFGSHKKLKWGTLRNSMDELGFGAEVWPLAEALGVPLEDKDWPLERQGVRDYLARRLAGKKQTPFEKFDKQFKGQEIEWGELKSFLIKHGLGDEARELRESPDSPLFTNWHLECREVWKHFKAALRPGDPALQEFKDKFGEVDRIKWGDLLGFLKGKGLGDGRAPGNEEASERDKLSHKLFNATLLCPEMAWPYIAEEKPENWKDPHCAFVGGWPERSWNEYRTEELTEKIVGWAKENEQLPLLAAQMRFVNPEAMYD